MAGREALDAVLHLMDRQVVDRDGLMVCKVDDLELTERADGSWEITGLLAGPAALVPRFGGRLGRALHERWRLLGLQERDRLVPWRVGLGLVAELGSGVRLLLEREGVLQRQTDVPPGVGEVRRSVNELLQLRVVTSAGEQLGRVLDLRARQVREEPLELLATGLVVGPGRPGALLGYDRDDEQGPKLLGKLVRRLHRHSGYAPLSQVRSIDWDARVLVLEGALQPLDHS